MVNRNDYFETSEDDFTEQKEEEISLEDEGTGTIKNSKITIEEFFDKKKVAILVCIILTLIFVSIYFAIIIAIFRFGSFGVENFIYVQF